MLKRSILPSLETIPIDGIFANWEGGKRVPQAQATL